MEGTTLKCSKNNWITVRNFGQIYLKKIGKIYSKIVFLVIETCFSFLIHYWPIRARECDMCNFSNFTSDFLIIFYRIKFYPDVEWYG